jgi:UDP-GlcNAc3NAcA epimerase
MKILTILGARPQFIKAGSLSRAIAKHSEIEEIIVHTGQHYDSNMSDVFFEEMNIPKPNYFLGIGGKTHGAMTGQMIEKIEEVALKENPDWILVYGDTNSTLAGAIVASKIHIPLAHIEAGLRSFNNRMPEEINRILTDRVSQLLFCPTKQAVDNLIQEGFSNYSCNIILSGDIMYDGALYYSAHATKPYVELNNKFILATIHRAENTNNLKYLKQIITAFNEINKQIQVVLPLHPRTKKIICENNITTNFTIIDPVGYKEMIWLISNSQRIATDSGGLQKEAYFFKKPCITIRTETEWVELVEHNFNILTNIDTESIIKTVLEHSFNMDYSQNLYGDGNTAKKIIDSLLYYNNQIK